MLLLVCVVSLPCYVMSASAAISLTHRHSIHTFKCRSEKALELGNKLEFQALVLMIWGATVPLVYYAFCDLPYKPTTWH